MSKNWPYCLLHFLIGALILWGVSGCSEYYVQGQYLESERRFEEAAFAYHRALLDWPNRENYQQALQRMRVKVVSDLLVEYRAYLKSKDYPKAFQYLERMIFYQSQHPAVKKEEQKWVRLLLAGQINIETTQVQQKLTSASQFKLLVKIQTPIQGQVLEMEVDPVSGLFWHELPLYQPTATELSAYSLLEAGIQLRYNASSGRPFVSQWFEQYFSRSAFTLTASSGNISAPSASTPLQQVVIATQSEKKPTLTLVPPAETSRASYSLLFAENQINVITAANNAFFFPKKLYHAPKQRRAMIDFGGYTLRSSLAQVKWRLYRNTNNHYLLNLSENHNLVRYLRYQGRPLVYVRVAQ